jgi:hypothetical protein
MYPALAAWQRVLRVQRCVFIADTMESVEPLIGRRYGSVVQKRALP